MIAFLKQIGTTPNDSKEVRLKKLTLVIIALFCITACPIWSSIYFFMGLTIAAFGPILFALMVVPALIHFSITKKEYLLIKFQIFFIVFCTTFMQWTSGGFTSGGCVMLWAFLAPLGALLFLDVKKAFFWFIVFVVDIAITIIFDNYFKTFEHPINPINNIVLIGMNILGPTIAIYFTMQYFVNKIIKNTAELNIERDNSQNLLFNILPEEVAAELQLKGNADAKLYSNVTVLFTDFVDFTKISERLTPQQLVNELHACFKGFDEIISKYNIEKIKTVGDAYLAVSGLPLVNPNHAEDVVRAAIEIRDFMNNRRQHLMLNSDSIEGVFEVRIGINTGSVVAGIVDIKKFSYDIWGDAVNTAARMEQNSQAGKINISQSTFELVKDVVKCEYRGEIDAKNKGMLKMYFVE